MNGNKVITFSVVGLGGRSCAYLNALEKHFSGRYKMVAVADPSPAKQRLAAEKYGVSEASIFNTDMELLKKERMSDVLIIGTMDKLHFRAAELALKIGYDIILEKPISTDINEVLRLGELAKQYPSSHIIVCHVLRYTKFFSVIKEIISSKELGEVVSIAHNENVGYYHFAHSYVRGAWNRSDTSGPVILTKSCHDLDILLYLLEGVKPTSIASFGGLKFFCRDNFKPDSMSKYCVDCSVEKNCPYSAIKIYGGNKIKSAVFDMSSVEKIKSSLGASPFGRCVFACDNNVCDHQSTIISFENGVSATFSLSAFTPKINRTIKVNLEYGEIRGAEKPYVIEVTNFRTNETRSLELNISEGGHGGGDEAFMISFMNEYLGDKHFISDIEQSIQSHTLAFLAEKSRLNNSVEKI